MSVASHIEMKVWMIIDLYYLYVRSSVSVCVCFIACITAA